MVSYFKFFLRIRCRINKQNACLLIIKVPSLESSCVATEPKHLHLCHQLLS